VLNENTKSLKSKAALMIWGAGWRRSMSRHMICLVDGTKVSASQASEYEGYSNVYELAYMLQLKDRSEDGRPQIVF
jgi:hypothetical protein